MSSLRGPYTGRWAKCNLVVNKSPVENQSLWTRLAVPARVCADAMGYREQNGPGVNVIALRRNGTGRRIRSVVVALALACVLTAGLCGCGGGTSNGTSTKPKLATTTPGASGPTDPSTSSALPVSYDGPTLQTPATAPPIVLHNYLGQPVNTAAYRGKAVLLTFIYTHCPDTCPLIVATLHNALGLLGKRASEARIVGVSTDPKGDTRQAITGFLGRRNMIGRMQYLVGSRQTLIPVWRAWGISVSKPTNQDEVNHTALVYGITGSGKVTTIYPANFTAADIAHDVPLLASH